MLFPALAEMDLHVGGEELDQLYSEVQLLTENAEAVVRAIEASSDPLWSNVAPQDTPEEFRARLRNVTEAIEIARTIPGGVVEIA